jgi:hypothetical protein
LRQAEAVHALVVGVLLHLRPLPLLRPTRLLSLVLRERVLLRLLSQVVLLRLAFAAGPAEGFARRRELAPRLTEGFARRRELAPRRLERPMRCVALGHDLGEQSRASDRLEARQAPRLARRGPNLGGQRPGESEHKPGQTHRPASLL